MAKISTYPIISLPTFNDLLIGTDVENLNETKNFTIGDIANLIIVGNYVPYVGATTNVDLGIHSITASSFIVPGGLSTEFVKADGSLDSTVYQPAGNYITGLSGEATASGPGVSAVVLSNGAVIGKVLTGLTITGGSISSSDSILQAFGKLQNQVNGLYGGAIYQGTWNASTNTPTLTSGVGVQGYYYIVSVAGSTNLDGITDWNVGDWAIFDGTAWQQVDNTDTVVSVNGQVGIVVLTTTDIAEGTNLYYTDTRARAALTLTTTGSSGASTYNNLTGAFNIPNYTLSGLGGVPSTRQLSINGTAYDLSADRSWSVGTVTSIGTSGPLTGGTITGSGTIGITQSGVASDGYLSSVDWNTFNNKQNALTNPVTGTGTVYYIPLWTGVSALGDSIISYSSNIVDYNYNSASGATVNYINTNGVDYTYSIQMNNVGTRQTYHSYTDGNIIQRINSNDVSRNLQSGQLVLPYYTATSSFTGTSVGYLGFDASGNILTLAIPSLAGYVTGSGTTNILPKWTSASSIGNSLLDDDGTSASVALALGGAFNIKYLSAIKLALTGGTTFGSIDVPIGLDFLIRPDSIEKFKLSSTGLLKLAQYGSGTVTGTSTYRLAVDATGNVIEVTDGGGTVTGTGAAGQVAYWTGTSSQTGSNNLFWDAANAKLGIGTNSPQTTLHIQGGLGSFRVLSSGAEVYLTRDGNNDILANGGTSAELSVGANNALKFWTGTTLTERARVTAAGNLLVGGTSDNGSRLQITGNASIFKTGIIRFDYSPGTSAMYMGDGSADMFLATQVIGGASNNPFGAYIYFKHSTSNVGIGTTSPSTRLEVFNSTDDRHFLAVGGAPSLSLGSSNTSPLYYATFGLATSTNNFIIGAAAGDLCILNRGSSVGNIIFGFGSSEAMRITTTGNLLVGTTTDTGQKFQVTGSTKLSILAGTGTRMVVADASGILSTQAIGSGSVTGSGTTNFLPKWTSGTALGDSLVFDNGTNVGINTTSPIYKLDVQGTSGTVAIRAASNTAGDILYYGTGSVTGSTDAFRTAINATGNVNLTLLNNNTATGSSALEISVPSASSGDPYLVFTTSGATNYTIGIDNSDSDKLKIGPVANPSVGADSIVLHTTGNTSLNSTTDAGFKLDVNGTARVSSDVTFGNDINLTRATSPAIVSTTNQNIRIVTNGFTANLRTDGALTTQTGYRTDGFIQTVNLAVGASFYNSTPPTNGAIIQGNFLVGTTTDVASSKVTISSTTQGFLPPRMTNAQRVAISSPVVGLIVYCTDATEGTYEYTSAGWRIVNTGGNITGTGTTNYIPKWTSGSALGNSLLQEGTNAIGLGVTSSAWGSNWKALELSNGVYLTALSSSTVPIIILGANAYFDNTNFIYKNTAAASRYQQDSGVHYWYNAPSGTAGNTISFTQAMTLLANGNLLVGGTSDNGSRLQINSGGPNTIVGLNVLGANSESTIAKFARGASEKPFYISSSNNTFVNLASEGALKFKVNVTADLPYSSGIDAMTIASTGNVGIGTTSPVYKLHVSGSSAILKLDSTGATFGNPSINMLQGAIDTILTATNNGLEIGTYSAHPIYFKVNASTTAMTILSGGNVGIGTTSPAYKLDVNGTLGVTGAATFSSSVEAGSFIYSAGRTTSFGFRLPDWQIYNTSGGSLAFNNYTTDFLSITSVGNVGIGTTAPAYKLDVNRSSLGTIAQFIANDGTYNPRLLINGTADGLQLFATFSTVADALMFGTGNTEKMRITSGGNVGINCTATNAKLEVVATTGEVFRADAASGAYRIVANQTGVRLQGNLNLASLPTSASGLVAGDVWNNGGVLNIV